MRPKYSTKPSPWQGGCSLYFHRYVRVCLCACLCIHSYVCIGELRNGLGRSTTNSSMNSRRIQHRQRSHQAPTNRKTSEIPLFAPVVSRIVVESLRGRELYTSTYIPGCQGAIHHTDLGGGRVQGLKTAQIPDRTGKPLPHSKPSIQLPTQRRRKRSNSNGTPCLGVER